MSEVPSRLAAALAHRYRLERELGQGGMATVYLAQDLRHDRNVALKVLKPELAAVLGAERFVVEIKTTAALQHPHILPLFDSGTADGFLYYVMPYIQGETLRSKLDRETQLGIEEAVRLTTEVADALDYAHRQGVIHRDIKPENILLHDGRPMVADFGIALAVSAAAGGRMTETGLSLGTPHYMSPEQATGEREITGRSDVYSLGSVLYEMLTGSPPHVGAAAQQIIMKIVTEDAQPVTRLRRAVPPNVAAAVAKSLEKLPADRFESARAFADALKNTAYTTVLPSAAASRPARWKPALAAGLLLGALAGAIAARAWAPAAGAAGGDRIREQLTFNGRSSRPAIAPAGDFVAFVETVCEPSRYGKCRSSLLVQEMGSTQSRVLLPDALTLGTPRWSHDGQVLVVNGRLDDDRAGLFAVSRLTGAVQFLGPDGAYDTHPTADSVLLVPWREPGKGVALILSLASAAIVDSVRLPFDWARDVSWSPDARHIAASTVSGITVVDRRGAVTASVPISNRQTLRWSDDGRALLTFRTGAVREDELVRLPMGRDGTAQGDTELFMSRVPTLYEGQFDVARRTGRLVLATGDAIGDIRSFDLTARPFAARMVARGTTWYGDPVLSADGASIFYFRGDAIGDNVYMLDRATGREEALTTQRLPGMYRVRQSIDGRRLIYARHRPGGTRIESMEFPSRRVVVDTTSARLAAVGPVASAALLGQRSADGALVLKAAPDAPWTAIPLPDSIIVVSFAASPDGAQLAFAGFATAASEDATTGPAPAREPRPLLGFVPLAGGTVRLAGRLEPREPAPSFSWDRDGSLYLARALPTDVAPSIWRMAPGNGALTRLGDLPDACRLSSIMVGALGRTAVCLGEDRRSDIWLIDSKRGTR